MKVSEFKNLEEGFFSDLVGIGSDVMSTVKSSPDYQKSQKDKQKERINVETQKRYLQDFIEDLVVDLDAAIKGNTIDLKAKGFQLGFTPERIEKIRPVVNKAIADGKITNASQLGAALAKKYPDIWKNTTNKTEVINSLMSGDLTKLPHRPNLPPDIKKPVPTTESTWYERMNRLIENYINEQAKESLSSWVMRWFAAYMSGVNWENEKTNIETIAREIESSYSKDRGKAAIQKLASKSWDLIKDVDTTPKGAQDVMGAAGTTNNTNLNDRELAKKIKDDADKLKKSNPDLYNKIKSSLSEKRVYHK